MFDKLEKHHVGIIITNDHKKNRTIKRGDILLTIEANWSDVVSYLGGYAQISKLGLSKKNKSMFDINVVLEKFEFSGSSICFAHIKIEGSEDALKFHKIPKDKYKYEGSYSIDYDKDYITLYNPPKDAKKYNRSKYRNKL